VLTVHINK